MRSCTSSKLIEYHENDENSCQICAHNFRSSPFIRSVEMVYIDHMVPLNLNGDLRRSTLGRPALARKLDDDKTNDERGQVTTERGRSSWEVAAGSPAPSNPHLGDSLTIPSDGTGGPGNQRPADRSLQGLSHSYYTSYRTAREQRNENNTDGARRDAASVDDFLSVPLHEWLKRVRHELDCSHPLYSLAS